MSTNIHLAIFLTSRLLAVLLVATPFCFAASPPGPVLKHVLVLHSYNQGYPFTDRENEGIHSVLDPQADWLEPHVVYMDTKRVTDSNYFEALNQLYRVQFANVRFDAVLAADNDALLFAVKYRTNLLANAPIIFSGINDFSQDMLAGQTAITGVIEASDYSETIKVALRLRPGARKVDVVVDGTTTGLAHKQAMERLAPDFQGRAEIAVYSLAEQSMPELLERLRGLSGEHVVLLLSHYLDRTTGRVYFHKESLELILKASAVPVFVVNETRLSHGVVGGKLVNGASQGRSAAEMLLRVLRGEEASRIPILTNSPNRWMFDYAALRRWNIPENRLPPGSLIINRPLSFYDQHRPVLLAATGVSLVFVVIIGALSFNISRRRRAEHALRESNQRLANFFDKARDAMFIADVETGVLLDANESAEQITGRSKKELIGLHQSKLHPPDQEEFLKEEFRKQVHLANGKLVEGEVITSAGLRVPVEINSSIIELANGKRVIQGIFRDITERKRLEDQLRQAQKMDAIGQLAGGVAHDFNNILTVIHGHLGLVLAAPELSPETRESLNELSTASDRAGHLTRQLLTFSRRQPFQMRSLDLQRVVEDVSKLLRRLLGEHIDMRFNYAPEPIGVEGDASMMEQIVLNLAINARDAMPQGGQLVISTAMVDVDEANARHHAQARPGRFACLTVSDTGCGMDEATLMRIYEPFFTTKEIGKGTGLGLATVYGVVQQHRGWIEVYSVPGEGTNFRVFLPVCSRRDPSAVASLAPPSAASGGQETILVVEDETSLRRLVVKCLSRQGYRLLEAASGVEALDVWGKHRHEIDLVLTDMVMPEGMNGKELVERLVADKPSLKAIYSSGYSLDVTGGDLTLEEGENFLPKPYDPATLAKTVRKRLDQKW